MTQKEKEAVKLIATLPLIIERCDNLRGSTLDTQEFKFVAKRLLRILEKKIDFIYETGLSDDKSQIEFNKITNVVDKFNEAIVTVEPERIPELEALIEAFINNEIVYS